MSGNTGEAHTFGINDGYSNDAWVNLVQGAKDITMNDGPEAVAVQQLDSAHDEEEEEDLIFTNHIRHLPAEQHIFSLLFTYLRKYIDYIKKEYRNYCTYLCIPGY